MTKGEIHAEPPGRPGRFAVEGTKLRWQGPTTSATWQGTTLVEWRLGIAIAVKGAANDDGTHLDLARGPLKGLWCYRKGDGRWKYGRLAVRPEGLLFVPSGLPWRAWPKGSLGYDLLRSVEIAEAAREPTVAAELYATLSSLGWRHKDGRLGRPTRRDCARIVASIRRFGEPATEYIYRGLEQLGPTENAVSLLATTGWSPDSIRLTPEGDRRAMKIARACTARLPSLEPAHFVGQFISQIQPGEAESDMVQSFKASAYSGKVTISEWDMFWDADPSAVISDMAA